jgi:NADPH2:quinone reductase
LREQVYAETDGRGVNIIIDPLGGEVLMAAIRAFAWCGARHRQLLRIPS